MADIRLLVMQYVGKQLPYDSINELRQRMTDVAPHLAKNDSVESPMWLNGEYFKVSSTPLFAVLRFWRCCCCMKPGVGSLSKISCKCVHCAHGS